MDDRPIADDRVVARHAMWGVTMLALTLSLLAAQVPLITAPVNDLAGVIDDERETFLTSHVEELRAKTGVQLAILVVTNLPHLVSIEDYSLKVAEEWRGGSADRDDGILLTLAMNDRKSRLEVGYGLEALITDGEAGAILQGMREKLRAGDVGGALVDATHEISDELKSLTPSSSRTFYRALGASLVVYRVVRLPLIMCLVGGLALLFVLSLRKRRPRADFVPRLVEHRALSFVTLVLAAATFLLVDATLFDLVELAGTIAVVAVSSVLFMCAASATDASTLKHATIAATVMGGIIVLALMIFPHGAVAMVGGILGCVLFAPFTLGFAGRIEGSGGDGSYSSSSSDSSWSSSSSSSSSSDYSGGGGSFGGGGASSDW